MYRYITFVWEKSDRRHAQVVDQLKRKLLESDPSWKNAYDALGLTAFHTGRNGDTNRVYPMGDGSGCVLGKLFLSSPRTEDASTEPSFDTGLTSSIVETDGKYLIERCWGSYVAFIRDKGDEHTHVLRSPVGRLPCLFVNCRGVRIFFSRTEDCVQLGVTEFTLDWAYIRRHIVSRFSVPLGGTGLKQVSQIFPGECLTTLADGERRATYWDPISIAQTDIIENREDATDLLKKATEQCTAAWVSSHRSVLVALSGGLDSSIVLSCAARAPRRPRITALNFVSPHVEGDEREFARSVATRYSVALHEVLVEVEDVCYEQMISHLERTAIPTAYVPRSPRLVEMELAQRTNATATLTGQYGDSVFLEGFMEHTTADYVQLQGLNAAALRIAYHEARTRQLTLWAVLFDAIGHMRRQPRLSYYSSLVDEFALLTVEAKQSIDVTSLHPPILANFDRIPRGKLIQILTCFQAFSYYDPFTTRAARPERIHVLGSQPLLEISFRIPTYLLSANGVGRALARDAFASHLPTQIVNRCTKGTGTEISRQALAHNLESIREVLIDGALVQQGIVDRRMLEASLANRDSMSVAVAAEIRVLLGTEMWVRRWAGSVDSRAVA